MQLPGNIEYGNVIRIHGLLVSRICSVCTGGRSAKWQIFWDEEDNNRKQSLVVGYFAQFALELNFAAQRVLPFKNGQMHLYSRVFTLDLSETESRVQLIIRTHRLSVLIAKKCNNSLFQLLLLLLLVEQEELSKSKLARRCWWRWWWIIWQPL